MTALLLAVLLHQLPGSCVKDSECAIATLTPCCGSCCPSGPGAYALKEIDAHRHRCATVDCAAPRCSAQRCESVESAANLEAVCRGNQCVAVHLAKAECSKDSECRVDYPPYDENAACRSSLCGCCPNTQPVAVPTQTPLPRPGPKPPVRPLTRKDGQDPQFGLSPGTTPPPQCSPCPAQEPAKAICAEKHCVLDGPHAL